MSYKRKTIDVWTIEGYYAQGFEEVTCETTRKAALDTLKTYRENENGTAFRVCKRREKITP